MKKKAFIPISALMGAFLLALVAAMTLLVAEPDIAYAQEPSGDATLKNLKIESSPGGEIANMTPEFKDKITAYEARIPFITTGVAVTATVNKPNATIKVNGQDATPGKEHIVPGLTAGQVNDVNIVVTAESGDKLTYTIKVYRGRQSLSDNANLSSLSISPGGLSPGFSASETSYNARVSSDKVTVSYRLSDTAGGASVGTITANGGGSPTVDGIVKLADEASVTTIRVPVTAEDRTTKTYIIAVYRIRANPHINANLQTLEITVIPAAGTTGEDIITKTFELDIIPSDGIDTEYKARVQTNAEMLTVVAKADDLGAIVTLPLDQNGNKDGHQVLLRKGALTTFTVNVTAEDPASTMTYTVKVYRNSAATDDLSEDNDLTRLSLSAGALSPSFESDETNYDATVGSDVKKVTVSYRLSDTSGGADAEVKASGPNVVIEGNEVTLAPPGAETKIEVKVTPESGPDENKEYTITIYRTRIAPSADASLSNLKVGGTNLSLVLGPGSTGRMYNATAPNGTGSVTVTADATAKNNGATVDIDPDSLVDLTAGMTTTITITVTAEDRATTDIYMVYVYRERATLSDDATLSALSLSAGTLDPAFMSDTIEYKSRVANDVDKVTVSHTLNDNAGGASAVVATSVVATSVDANCSKSKTDYTVVSGDVSLTAGVNTNICVTATAEDGSTTESYLITVYRLRANANTDASLNAFAIAEATDTIKDITGTGKGKVLLDLLASENETPDVVYRVRQVTVVATADIGAIVTIMPADADTGRTGHQVDLTAGAETEITVQVMPEDPVAASKTYTANVYRKNVPGSESDDATLSSLMLSGGVLTPAFSSGTMEYEVAASYSTIMTTVSAMANHLGAQSSIEMDGHQVDLAVGENTVEVMVTAEDGTTTETYTITVTRADALSDDASLSSLDLSGLTLDPVFDPAITMYTAEAAEALGTTTVEAMATHPDATVEGTGEMSLSEGENTISVTVTAEDGTTTETYTVTVTVPVGDELLDLYDVDNDNQISKDEAIAAINDYLFGEGDQQITKAQVIEVINLYLFG